MIRHDHNLTSPGILSVVLLISFGMIAHAQSIKIQGLIKARNGPVLIVATPDSPSVNVLLTDYTEVGQIQGVLKARRKQMSMAALIPGLAIQAEGTYNDQNQIVAKQIKFKGDDLQKAKSIQAGMHETQVKVQQNKEELEKHNAALQAQSEALRRQ